MQSKLVFISVWLIFFISSSSFKIIFWSSMFAKETFSLKLVWISSYLISINLFSTIFSFWRNSLDISLSLSILSISFVWVFFSSSFILLVSIELTLNIFFNSRTFSLEISLSSVVNSSILSIIWDIRFSKKDNFSLLL